ncbi:MAG TPA: protein-methionine-sulfoxide reductase heme-binding subunit MsrQ [Woeseiaceae bacterium]|nr:protein-methionine-sulfoxide reductase heme-binding subunit MsrQ [Woeseiaceae bacterium]
MNTTARVRYIGKPLLFVLCLVPVVLLLTDAAGISGSLGANPVEAIQDHFGIWGLRFIMITLAVTPLRQLTGWNWLARFRRMLGLFTFFYVLMHFLTWLVLDQGLLLSAIAEDITKRPFITIGFLAFLLLTMMAVTSTNALRRRMGRRWQQLHYSAYAVGVLGVWHFWWQVKLDTREPLLYAAILSVLLGYRLYRRRPGRARARREGKAPAAGVRHPT